jgi:tetratricopeptide (TPR) repeat protein
MPPSSSIDIPHIRITDHYISRVTDFNERQLSETQQSDIAKFLGLQILTKENPTPLEMAEGYIAMYDKNLQDAVILDSAFYYLSQTVAEGEVPLKTWVHFYFAREDYTPIAKIAANRPAATINDAWMAYRIGEAFFQLEDPSKSLLYYKRATQLQKYNLDFQEKLGVNYLKMGSIPQAKQVFEFVLSEHPKRTMALTNLGFVYVQLKQLGKARDLYQQALRLDPDYLQTLVNMAALEDFEGNKKGAQALIDRAALIAPNDEQVLRLQNRLQ